MADAVIATGKLTIRAGGRELVSGLDLALAPGECWALLGPNGAGKSSLILALAGLRAAAAGSIEVDGRPLSRHRRAELARRVGVPLQDDTPDFWGTALEYARLGRYPHGAAPYARDTAGESLVRGWLERLDLGSHAEQPYLTLSGGERQRVRVAQLLVQDPGVLLLDEPLSALDAHTRGVVRGELAELLAELRLPTLLVTHDFEDAAALADRVGVIVEGRILQLGLAAELLAAPADAFVASFTGANLLHGTARAGADGLTEVVLDAGGSMYSADGGEGRVGLAVYPWEIALARSEPADSAMNHLRGAVRSVVVLGNRVRVRVGPLTAEITAGSADRLELREGEPVVASFKATASRLVPLS
jgi:molybdate transport system ATP-binding protein